RPKQAWRKTLQESGRPAAPHSSLFSRRQPQWPTPKPRRPTRNRRSQNVAHALACRVPTRRDAAFFTLACTPLHCRAIPPTPNLMDPAFLTAAAGLLSRRETLELLGNNIANANTAGFKADREFYNLFLSAAAGADPAGDFTWMPVVEGSAIDLRQATFTPT